MTRALVSNVGSEYEEARSFYRRDAEPYEAQLATDEHSPQCRMVRSVAFSTFEQVLTLPNNVITQEDILLELGIAQSTVCHHTKRA